MSESKMGVFDYSELSVSGDDAAFLECCARGVESGLKVTVDGILEIGRALCAARDKLNGNDILFGQWRKGRLPWLRRHTANNFMNVFDKFGGGSFLVSNNSTAEISPTILYALAAPSVPESAVVEITTRIQSGEKMKVKEVQEVIKQAKSKVVPFPSKQTDMPLPTPLKPEVLDMMPVLKDLGISKEWVSTFFYVHRDLDFLYRNHFSGRDRDAFMSAFAASLPSDVDLTCVYQLYDFLSKLVAALSMSKRGVSHS